MADITAKMVQELRQKTGAGVMDCRQALQASDGDFEKASTLLREKGLVAAAKRAEREAKEGLIGSYIHAGSKVAALVEVNCETDFVARTDEFKDLARCLAMQVAALSPQFKELVHDLAMQVVAAKPSYLALADVPADVLEQEKAKYLAEMQDSGKPAPILERVVEGKLKKFYEESCLLEQPFIKDPAITVRELVQQRNALLGENVVVRRFVRFEVGG
jgi:elongation factor Ts